MTVDGKEDRALRSLPGIVVETRIQDREIRFFVQNEHDHIQSHHLQGIFYEREELAIIARYFVEGGVFVDIGTNVGNHTIFIEKFCNPRQIINFEINPDAIAIFAINRCLNELKTCEIGFLGIALAHHEGRVSLVQPEPNNLGCTGILPDSDGALRSLPGDELLAMRPVDLIKIDVEGTEMAVLEGLRQTIDRWRPGLFIEVDDANSAIFAAWCEKHAYHRADAFQRYEGKTNFMMLPAEKA